MRKGGLSTAGLSVTFALGLAAWEVYFFWFAGSFKHLEGTIGLFTPDRLGFNMAWLAATYLTFQLLSIPFSLPSSVHRFIGVVELLELAVPRCEEVVRARIRADRLPHGLRDVMLSVNERDILLFEKSSSAS